MPEGSRSSKFVSVAGPSDNVHVRKDSRRAKAMSGSTVIRSQLEQFEDRGYFILDDMVPEAMLDELEAATRRVREKVMSRELDIGGNYGSGDPKSIHGMWAPEYGEAVFQHYLTSAPIIEMAQLFHGPQVRLGYVHLWNCNPGSTYDTGWHRDLAQAERDASEEEEMQLLRRPKRHLKWHLALVDDPFFSIIPGSQHRPRTGEEREVLVNDRKADLTGQKPVVLKRGQTLYWDTFSIHRGRVREGEGERLTLTGGLSKFDPQAPKEKLNPAWQWRLRPNLRASLIPTMQLWFDRWRELQDLEA